MDTANSIAKFERIRNHYATELSKYSRSACFNRFATARIAQLDAALNKLGTRLARQAHFASCSGEGCASGRCFRCAGTV